MADPFGAVAGALGVADLAFKVGLNIYNFVQAAKHVDKTLEELADEVKALGEICKAISEINFVDPALVVTIDPQLVRCQEILVKLDIALPTMPADASRFMKPTMQFKLNLRQGDIDEYRQQIAHSTSNLQLSLQLLSLKATYIAPQLANAALFDEMKKIARLLRSRDHSTLDRTLVNYADEVMSEGRSLYAQSEAPGSVVGVSSALQRMVMSDWIDTIVTLRHDAETGASSQSAFSEPSYDSSRPDTSTPATSECYAGPEAELSEDDGEDSDHRLAIDLSRLGFAEGNRLFQSGDYAQAETMLQEGLKHLQTLPEHLRRTYALEEPHFQLAVCSFHLHSPEAAESALLSITGQQSTSDLAAVQQLKASLLLAQVYVRQGRLELARTSATRVYSSPRNVLSRDSEVRFNAVALLYRITLLSPTPGSAALYAGLLPSEQRETYCHLFDDLHILDPQPDMQQSPGADRTVEDRPRSVVRSDDRSGSVSTLSSTPTPTTRPNLTPTTSSTLTRPLSTISTSEQSNGSWYMVIPSNIRICRYNGKGKLVATADRGSSQGSAPYCIGVLETRSGVWMWARQYKIDALPTSLDVSPSGYICVWAYKSNFAIVQSLETGKTLHHLTIWSRDLQSVSFTATDQVVLTLHDKKGNISDNFKLSRENCLAMVADSTRPGFGMHIVDCTNGKLKTAWKMNRSSVKNILWSRDNTKVAVVFRDLTQAGIYNSDGEIQRTITVKGVPVRLKRSTDPRSRWWSELTWIFLDNDLILVILLRQQNTLLAAYDASVKKWWYIPLAAEVIGVTQFADGTMSQPSLSPDDRILLHSDNNRRVLLDIGAAIRHCRLQQDDREIAAYEEECQVPAVEDSAMT